MNEFYSLKDIEKCTKTKEEMYDELNGKMVKCITSKSEDVQLFAVQDIENNKVYFLDNIVSKGSNLVSDTISAYELLDGVSYGKYKKGTRFQMIVDWNGELLKNIKDEKDFMVYIVKSPTRIEHEKFGDGIGDRIDQLRFKLLGKGGVR